MAETDETSESAGPKLVENTPIVDTDVHVISGLTDEKVARYLDEPYKSWLLNPRNGIGRERDPYMGGKIEQRSIADADQLHEELVENYHVDHPIINPFARLSNYHQSDLPVELMRAYNRAFIDLFLDENDDFYGMIELAPQQPDKAAEEIDDLGQEDQIVGAWLLSSGAQPPLGDPKYDIMYRAAEDRGLTIAYHGAGPGAFPREFPKQDQGLERLMSVHTVAHPWNQMLTLTSLIVQGVPVKFPDLNFAFLEAGISWVPYLMFRMNKEYAMRRNEAPLLEKSPEEYVRDSFYFSSQPLGEPNDPRHLQQMISILGPENIMFASDYPHWDFDHPEGMDRHLRATFSGDERDQVLHKTAAEAFHLDL
ncbi:amidohydrolase family protein [Halobacteriales archaeon Cl-PHB]